MCENLKPYDEPSFTGYKLVAKKEDDDGYYSLAMGFKYPIYPKSIPKVKKQKRISSYFASNILEKRAFAFRKEMQGRTAVFVNKESAKSELEILYSSFNLLSGYYAKVVKATILDELMKGEYAEAEVIAGRKIKFHEEIDDYNQA